MIKHLTYSLLCTGLLMMGFTANAQDFSFGARGGISIPNLSAGSSDQNPLNTGYKSREGAEGSLFGEYKVSKLFSVEVMVEYCSQGGQKNGLQAFPPQPELVAQMPPSVAVPQYFYANYQSTAKLDYMMLPILAKFGWNLSKTSPFRIYVDAGPFLGYLVAAHQLTSGASQIYLDANEKQPVEILKSNGEPMPLPAQPFWAITNIKDQLHAINLGIEGNVGLSYHWKRNSVFIEGGGDYGFLNIQKGTANGKNNTGAATGAAGYRFDLPRKSKAKQESKE
jgi:hypothetical protein